MNGIKLGNAISVCVEIKTIRKIKSAIVKYEKYAHFHKIDNLKTVTRLLKRLKQIDGVLTGRITSCYSLPYKYRKFRIAVEKLGNIETMWYNATGLPWETIARKKNKLLDYCLNKMSIKKIKARQSELIWRLVQEIIDKTYNGYYIIFNTLTVEPRHYNNLWKDGSAAFKTYLKCVNYGKDDTYFAVREAGAAGGRLHIHVLHLLKTIPKTWLRDPNENNIQPINREIKKLRAFWPHGFSNPIAIRFNSSDAWSKLGWRWPLERVAGLLVPVQPTSPGKLAGYLSKYLVKTLNVRSDKWKTKMSRNLGLRGLQSAMKIMEDGELQTLIDLTTSTLVTLGTKSWLPKNLLVREATREIIQRKSKQKNFVKKLSEITPLPSIVEHWKCLTTRKPRSKYQNIPYIMMQTSRNMVCSNPRQVGEKLLKSTVLMYNPVDLPYSNHIEASFKNGLNI